MRGKSLACIVQTTWLPKIKLMYWDTGSNYSVFGCPMTELTFVLCMCWNIQSCLRFPCPVQICQHTSMSADVLSLSNHCLYLLEIFEISTSGRCVCVPFKKFPKVDVNRVVCVWVGVHWKSDCDGWLHSAWLVRRMAVQGWKWWCPPPPPQSCCSWCKVGGAGCLWVGLHLEGLQYIPLLQ